MILVFTKFCQKILFICNKEQSDYWLKTRKKQPIENRKRTKDEWNCNCRENKSQNSQNKLRKSWKEQKAVEYKHFDKFQATSRSSPVSLIYQQFFSNSYCKMNEELQRNFQKWRIARKQLMNIERKKQAGRLIWCRRSLGENAAEFLKNSKIFYSFSFSFSSGVEWEKMNQKAAEYKRNRICEKVIVSRYILFYFSIINIRSIQSKNVVYFNISSQ